MLRDFVISLLGLATHSAQFYPTALKLGSITQFNSLVD